MSEEAVKKAMAAAEDAFDETISEWGDDAGERAIAAAIAAYEAALWQPIETAPRDGTPILLVCKEDGDVIEAHYTPDEGGDPCWYLDGMAYPTRLFTHWRPLPKPPEVKL